MNTEKSQEEIKTPKYKVGDEVWTLAPVNIAGINAGFAVIRTLIIAQVYSRVGGFTKFEGYKITISEPKQITREPAIFKTREAIEAKMLEIESGIPQEEEEE